MEELKCIAKKYGGTFAKYHIGGDEETTYFYIVSDIPLKNREVFEKELKKKRYYINEFFYEKTKKEEK